MPVNIQAPPAKPKTPTVAEKKAVIAKSERLEGLNGILSLASFGLIAGKQFADAGAVSLHGPKLMEEIAELAEANSKIAEGIDRLISVGPYAGLVAAGMPLILQFMVNHGAIQAGIGGTVSGKVLDAQVKTELMKQEQEALRRQREAESELEALQKERDFMAASTEADGD